MHDETFFVYQRQALKPLLVWGVGSSIGGSLLLLVPGLVRHFGIQAAAWGTIDVLLAIFARRRALLKAEAVANGDLEEQAVAREAEQFRNILAFNAGLDVLYIVVGLAIAARAAERPNRRGLGYGVATQGAFLLAFDALLARNVGRRFLI